MKPKNIVIGQKVSSPKIDLARRLRKETSPVERLLWQRLRGNQLNGRHFRRQQIVAGFVADFYCHRAGLAIEIDGSTHKDPVRDAARDQAFLREGIKVIRFTNAQMMHETNAVIHAIAQYLDAAP